jgi:wobble nucleotide-excising tRNase
MLKKIKLIQGIGGFTKTTAGSIDLGDVTIIYGENRNGKSTLCDVMYSLAENNTDFILNRKSIPNNQAQPPKVELMFSTRAKNVTAIFENSQWAVRNPECSKLYVFDQSFIHRNVITGQKLERSNSKNMTSFILGEDDTALLATLEKVNIELREERKLLSDIEEQFTPHSVGNVSEYVNSDLPTETKERLEAKESENEASKRQINQT